MKIARVLLLVLMLAATGASARSYATRTGAIGERVAVAANIFVIPEAVISDSRCPTNAECAWAGTVILAAQVQFPDGVVPVKLHLGAPKSVGTGKLLLQNVTPAKGFAAIPPQNYRLTFAWLPPA